MTLPFILPRLLKAPDAAAYLGVSESKLRTMQIPRKVLDGLRLYDRLTLDAYADSLTTEGEDRGNTCDGLFGASG